MPQQHKGQPMANRVSHTRHDSFFDIENIRDKTIHVVGAGATGSYTIISIAKLGAEKLHIWDPDIVEEHNIANQAYSIEDIGKPKVSAMAETIRKTTGLEISTNECCLKNQPITGIVFLCTDSMASRKEIFNNCILYNPHLEMFVDTRMGTSSGMIIPLRPCHTSDIEKWNAGFYDDTAVTPDETGACHRKISIGPTAQIVSQIAVWQLISYLKEPNDLYYHEINIGTHPKMCLHIFNA